MLFGAILAPINSVLASEVQLAHVEEVIIRSILAHGISTSPLIAWYEEAKKSKTALKKAASQNI